MQASKSSDKAGGLGTHPISSHFGHGALSLGYTYSNLVFP